MSSTAVATSRPSRRARRPSPARRKSTTRLFAEYLGVAHPVGGVGEGMVAVGGLETQHTFDISLSVKALAADPLPVALEDPAADVGVEGGWLDAEHGAGLG